MQVQAACPSPCRPATSIVDLGNDGDLVVRFDEGAGFNHSPKAGQLHQPTNLHWLKGSAGVSVVPTSPKLRD